jgi:hypothetical protein
VASSKKNAVAEEAEAGAAEHLPFDHFRFSVDCDEEAFRRTASFRLTVPALTCATADGRTATIPAPPGPVAAAAATR